MENPLIKLANARMPFGKYQGLFLIDLPEDYVLWLHAQANLQGELHRMIKELYEIKVNGLEYLLTPLREKKS